MIRSALSLLSALVIGSTIPATAGYAAPDAGQDLPLQDGQENETMGDADADSSDTEEASNTGSDDDAPLYNEQEEAIVDQKTLNRVGEEQGGPAPLPDEQY
jgi:hypothetical protein